MDRIWIAPSLLSADMANFVASMNEVASEAHLFHCDVMDGHFVPNLTFGAPVIKSLKKASKLPLDVHLMIENPAHWVPKYLEAGLTAGDFLTFHIEAEPDPVDALRQIRKKGVGAGIVLKPKTLATAIKGLENEVDQVLIMTVEPGFGGQSFMEDMNPKIAEVRATFPSNVLIAVDGGIDEVIAPRVVKAGARLLVAGSAIFGRSQPLQAAKSIRIAAQAALEGSVVIPTKVGIQTSR